MSARLHFEVSINRRVAKHKNRGNAAWFDNLAKAERSARRLCRLNECDVTIWAKAWDVERVAPHFAHSVFLAQPRDVWVIATCRIDALGRIWTDVSDCNLL